MTDAEFLAEVKSRADRATEGPWVVDRPWLSRGMMHVDGVMPRANLHPDAPYLVETVHNHGSKSAAKHVAVPAHGHSADDRSDAANNMEFIAHAREDVPRLLAMIEERNEKLRVTQEECDKWRQEYQDLCPITTSWERRATIAISALEYYAGNFDGTDGTHWTKDGRIFEQTKFGTTQEASPKPARNALAKIRGSDDKT